MLKQLLMLLLILAPASIVSAQTISPEKAQAIRELSAMINADNKAEDMARAVTAQMDIMRADIVRSILTQRDDLSKQEKDALEKDLIAAATGFGERFQKKLFQKINFQSLMDEVVMIVYDKYFTTEEINDLLTFYRTPTGRKMLKLTQPLMVDTMQLTQARLIPKISGVIDEIMAEERAEITRKANELKPRTVKKPR